MIRRARAFVAELFENPVFLCASGITYSSESLGPRSWTARLIAGILVSPVCALALHPFATKALHSLQLWDTSPHAIVIFGLFLTAAPMVAIVSALLARDAVRRTRSLLADDTLLNTMLSDQEIATGRILGGTLISIAASCSLLLTVCITGALWIGGGGLNHYDLSGVSILFVFIAPIPLIPELAIRFLVTTVDRTLSFSQFAIGTCVEPAMVVALLLILLRIERSTFHRVSHDTPWLSILLMSLAATVTVLWRVFECANLLRQSGDHLAVSLRECIDPDPFDE